MGGKFSGTGLNPTNKTSRYLSYHKRKRMLRGSGKLYEQYLADPTAQYEMTFLQYKRKKR